MITPITIQPIPVSERMPDDWTAVLMFMSDGEIREGYCEGVTWFYTSEIPVKGCTVLAWADMPTWEPTP